MNRRIVRFGAAWLSVLAIVFASFSAFAGPATDLVKTKQTALFSAIRASNNGQISQLFDQLLEYDAFAEASLGSEWAARSSAEQQQFTDLLKKLVRRAYECNLKKIVDYQVSYTGEKANGSSVVVETTATAPSGGDPVEINFTLKQGDAGWKVQDIETEGVSLVQNNRAQFLRIIKKDGFPALLQKMKDKLAKQACES